MAISELRSRRGSLRNSIRPGHARRLANRRWLWALLAIAFLSVRGGAPASAQTTPPTIESAELRLWPEYDDPGLLVIYAGKLDSGVTVPVQMTFPVPASARGFQATIDDPAQGLISQPYQVTGGQLVYSLSQRAFQIEYYLDRAGAGAQREIHYTFRTPYAVKALTIVAQQPLRASSFSMTPQPEKSGLGPDGLMYFTLVRGNLAPGDAFEITLAYTKLDEALSISSLPSSGSGANNAVAAGSGAAASGSLVTSLAYVLIGMGLSALVGSLAYWVLNQRRKALRDVQVPSDRIRERRAVASLRPDALPGGFCGRCGHPVRAGDRFCGSCGAPRKEKSVGGMRRGGVD